MAEVANATAIRPTTKLGFHGLLLLARSRRTAPATPVGMRYTKPIMNIPKIAHGAAFGDLVGDIGHELDEKRSVQGARDRREPADDDSDQQHDGEKDVEAVRRHELDCDRAKRPATPVYSAETPKASDL